MALLDILEVPDRRLTTVCSPVERIDGDFLRLLDDMLATMYAAPGIGLAAPQVGVLRRAFVADVGEEGCLSLPKQFGEVARADRVRVRYLDRAGDACEIAAEGLLARCLQHELDHLDGILFVDHLSALKRTMILRRLAKAKRARESA